MNIPADLIVRDPFLTTLEAIPTRDQTGQLNGCVVSILNTNEGDQRIEQVYLTVAEVGFVKGPHVHTGDKTDRFFCTSGDAIVVCRNEQTNKYFEFILEARDHRFLTIPAYVSHAILSAGSQPAIVLSMPTEGYDRTKPYNQEAVTYKNYNWNKWFV